MKLGARHPEVETVNPNDRMEGKGIQIGGSVGLAQDGVLRAEVKGGCEVELQAGDFEGFGGVGGRASAGYSFGR